jgi:hypothetical protein
MDESDEGCNDYRPALSDRASNDLIFIVQHAEAITDRRLTLSGMYLAINSALLAVESFLFQQDSSGQLARLLPVVASVAVTGVVSCAVWAKAILHLAKRTAWWYSIAASLSDSSLAAHLAAESTTFYRGSSRLRSTRNEIGLASLCGVSHVTMMVLTAAFQ